MRLRGRWPPTFGLAHKARTGRRVNSQFSKVRGTTTSGINSALVHCGQGIAESQTSLSRVALPLGATARSAVRSSPAIEPTLSATHAAQARVNWKGRKALAGAPLGVKSPEKGARGSHGRGRTRTPFQGLRNVVGLRSRGCRPWLLTRRPIRACKVSRKLLPFREGGTGDGSPSRGKPDGVRAAEIWVKVGQPAPAKDADWLFQQAAQRSPAEMTSDQEDIGKPIWIRARWLNTRGEPGPWSLAQNTVIA